jgi:hypothetical protein
MARRIEMVSVTLKADEIAKASHLVFWLSSEDSNSVDYHERDVHRCFKELAAMLGYSVERLPETASADEDGTATCPVCGNEERGQGGYLNCECPAPSRQEVA